MVDFDTFALPLSTMGVKVVGVSVDTVEQAKALSDGLMLGYVELVADVDAEAVAAATHAKFDAGGRPPYLHATGFLLDPGGEIVTSVYASGPIGRLTPGDIIRKVSLEQAIADAN